VPGGSEICINKMLIAFGFGEAKSSTEGHCPYVVIFTVNTFYITNY